MKSFIGIFLLLALPAARAGTTAPKVVPEYLIGPIYVVEGYAATPR